MHHYKTYMYLNFQQNIGAVDQSKPGKLNYLRIMASCINLQLPIVILKKSTLSDMHDHITYIYINFQQNRASSVKTVHTHLLAKKIASCINLQLPMVIFKKSII